MSLRNFFKKIRGNKGHASRSKKGAGSHVNTRKNKRAANKGDRYSYRAHLFDTLLEDHHLDIPDEIKEKYDEL